MLPGLEEKGIDVFVETHSSSLTMANEHLTFISFPSVIQ